MLGRKSRPRRRGKGRKRRVAAWEGGRDGVIVEVLNASERRVIIVSSWSWRVWSAQRSAMTNSAARSARIIRTLSRWSFRSRSSSIIADPSLARSLARRRWPPSTRGQRPVGLPDG